MLFTFLETADASAVAQQGGGWANMLITLAAFLPIIALMYFFMIRPQRKQEKEVAKMRSSLEIGDTVTTIGGIIGIVTALKEDTVVIETGGDRTKIRFKRSAIAEVEKLKLDD